MSTSRPVRSRNGLWVLDGSIRWQADGLAVYKVDHVRGPAVVFGFNGFHSEWNIDSVRVWQAK
jgi:hypothetical protein